ncbi:MAG: hypothetical protein EWV60_14100 [Microcystis sp. Msp_OC_L_20101000_S702]|nr:MAG: hypothetical protein EWV60_14100 [Microcystis sp. Msp_OC_L_20101000_S702]
MVSQFSYQLSVISYQSSDVSCQFTDYCLLFTVHCSLKIPPTSHFPLSTPCSLFTAPCLLFG